MLEISDIRNDPSRIEAATRNKGFDSSVVGTLLEADRLRLQINSEVETLRAEKNKLTASQRERGREIKELLNEKEVTLKEAKENFRLLMLKIPNPAAADVKIGTAEDNEILRKVGEPPTFLFQPRDHVELGRLTETIDIKRGAKVAQSGFYYLKDDGARLEFALVQLAFNRLSEKGFTPVITPNVVKEEILVGCGFQARSEKENQTYHIEDEDLALIATAEITLVGQHANEIIDVRDLPKKYVGYSYCYRRERGSYGSDVRGIKRVHEFRKAEMVVLCLPQESDNWHERLLETEEELWQDLAIPYQVVKMASGDLGNAAVRKYDIEAYIPSQQTYMEVTSTSNVTDFQPRRLGIKYRDGKKPTYLHALNGTVFALGRTMLSIYENNQLPDGSIKIPEVLQPWMNGQKIIKVK